MRVILSSALLAPGLVSAVTECPGYNVVKEVSKVQSGEREEIVAAIKKMKTIPSAYDPAWNSYDYFAHTHVQAAGPPPESPHAHWSFAFWHREFMNRWNKELQRASGNSALTWPYWNFFDEASTESMLSDLNYIGGAGKQEDGYILKEGQLRDEQGFPIYRNATWWPQASEQGAILRARGNGVLICMDENGEHYSLDNIFNLPDQDSTQATIENWLYLKPGSPPEPKTWALKPDAANKDISWGDSKAIRKYNDDANVTKLTCKHYAASLPDPEVWMACLDPWRPFGNTSQLDANFLPGNFFSPCLEGLDLGDEYALGLERLGASIHSPHGHAHQYVGGSVNQPSAPSDPVFAHIHMNVDRLFREAQLRLEAKEWSFDLNYKLSFFDNPTVTVGETVDTAKQLGYLFDTEAACPASDTESPTESPTSSPTELSGSVRHALGPAFGVLFISFLSAFVL